MRKRRYEILLPLKFNDGKPVPDECLNQTREDLLGRFDGLTVHPRALLGLWQHEGQHYEDELVRFTVDVEDTEENQFFFINRKATLLERFQQPAGVLLPGLELAGPSRATFVDGRQSPTTFSAESPVSGP